MRHWKNAGRVCVFLLGAWAFSSGASAQGGPGVHFGVSGGADFPTQDQHDVFDTGWNGTALITFNAGAAPIGLRVDGSYQRMNTKSGLVGFVGSGNVRILDGTVDLVLGPHTGAFEPYAIGGVGGYDMRFHGEDLANGTFSDSNTRFGWNAGGGLAFPLGASNSRIFVEARYTSVSRGQNRFTDSITTHGRRFTFVPVNLGIVF
jgi:opacity protein-like surface antigen